jgi:hypothetical protein
MKISPEKLYQKIQDLAKKVRNDFRRKGLIIPTKNDKDTIRVGRYLIKRKENEFYAVISVDGEVMADQLNLPQTAALIANQLALKQQFDRQLIEKDRDYGYACFEDQLYTRAKERMLTDPNYNDIKVSKYHESGERAEELKKSIISQFEKLNKIA